MDVFTVHGFVLREDQTWGAGIPPGLDAFAHEGQLYELADHRDLEIFKTQIRDFRRWMADNGLREKPLIVSEYGILMPADYGFAYKQVRDFMLGSFDFFRAQPMPRRGIPPTRTGWCSGGPGSASMRRRTILKRRKATTAISLTRPRTPSTRWASILANM
ncbi:MAG: hypothetical protein R2911_27460 [Caldilineaceae bacterium]